MGAGNPTGGVFGILAHIEHEERLAGFGQRVQLLHIDARIHKFQRLRFARPLSAKRSGPSIQIARAFAKMDELWKIHFRNVSGPIPRFVETFVDNGYTDMLKLMKTLCEVDFRGAVIADDVPTMVDGPCVGCATASVTSRRCRRRGVLKSVKRLKPKLVSRGFAIVG